MKFKNGLKKVNIAIVIRKSNLGIELLRTILCFWVISFHYVKKKKIHYFFYYIIRKKLFHVPCFSFISFYFSYNIFFHRNITKFKQRIKRLLIPYIIWPLFTFIIDNFCLIRKINFYKLVMQILLGSQFMIHFWYLFSMIFMTLFLFIFSNLINLIKCNFLFIIQIKCFILFYLQYSQLSKFLYAYNKNIRYPLLYTFEIFPTLLFGLIFGSSKIIHDVTIQNNKKKVIFLSFISIFCFFKLEIFINIGSYKGVEKSLISLLFFISFYLLPFENISNLYYRIIKQITNYTNGIYCLQSEMIPLINKIISLNGNLKGVSIIYLLSYFISFVGNLIFGKTILKYLFI